MIKNRRARGFTLVEILIAMTLLTLISAFMLSSLGPWLAFKQKLDTDRKLMEVKALFSTIYERNAWTVETDPGPVFTFSGGVLTNSPMNGATCVSQIAALNGLSQYFSDGLPAGEQDGHGNPFCILISPQLTQFYNGLPVYYHNIALVSMGRNAVKEAGTSINPANGALTLAGDDTGILITGFTIHSKKYQETADRLDRVAKLYEQYFTARFLSNPARDVTIDYFAAGNPSGSWDTSGGTVPGTGLFAGPGADPISSVLASLGIGPEEGQSAYEINNTMYVANFNETVPAGPAVRSSVGGTPPPFTAILYAPMPGGTNLVKIATGNY